MPFVSTYLSTEYRTVSISFPPSYKALKAVSLDHQLLVGQYMVIKVITYFGGRSIVNTKPVTKEEFYVMYRNLETATKLDPYNIDAYYFAQAALTWEVQEYRAANALLEYGMKYRTWDYYLPFFVAFNYSYFLKDALSASKYYRKAAELTGNDLFIRLASRNLYEAGQTVEALAYLKVMIESSRNEALKQMLKKRYDAFVAVRMIEQARDNYLKHERILPTSLGILIAGGYLKYLPVDPYGGVFVLDGKGVVRSSSNFTELKGTVHDGKGLK
jgi:tetratricopeptide (TPR) repeat protein